MIIAVAYNQGEIFSIGLREVQNIIQIIKKRLPRKYFIVKYLRLWIPQSLLFLLLFLFLMY